VVVVVVVKVVAIIITFMSPSDALQHQNKKLSAAAASYRDVITMIEQAPKVGSQQFEP
jgi:hypothetical protein